MLLSILQKILFRAPFFLRSALFIIGISALGIPALVVAENGLIIEEVVVTARKREESLMNIPDAITVFSDAVIETANISSIRDFADLTPNLTIIDQLRPGTQTVTIRGMTTVQNGELPLAFIVDGVNAPSMNFINQELIDIERIEVLRGPQGTLYGRGAVGGAINIVTKAPTDEFSARAKASYGRGDSLFLGATVSGPIADDLHFRLSASHRNEDGLIDNVGAGTEADPVDEQSFQGRLIYRPNDRLTLDLRGRYLHGETGGLYLVRVTTPTIDDFSIPVSSNINGADERDVGSVSFKFDYQLANGTTLTSISAYSETDSFFFGDGDFSTAKANAQDWEIDVRAFNQELRLTSDSSQELRWIFGAFYQDREDKEFTNFGTQGPGPSLGSTFPGGAREIRDRRSWAVFASIDYDLTERLTLSAGIRYDEERNATELRQLGASPEETFSEWQPKVSLSYDWTEAVMTYFTFSRGFRPGGFSNQSGVLYENEVSDNFEIGTKAFLFDQRIQLSAAIFYIDFADQQYFFSRVTDAGVRRFIINIAETANIGAELEMAIYLTEGLKMNFGFALTDTEIDDFNGTGAFKGNNTPQVNDYSFNASAEYTRAFFGPWQFTGRIDYENRGEVDWDLNNLVTTPAKDYLNLYAGIENENWTVYLYGKNVLGTRQPTAMGTDVFGPGIHLRTPSRPATYGIGIQASF